MPLATLGESTILNALLTGRFLSLHTADPTIGGNEVAGGAYARVAYGYVLTGTNPTVAGNPANIEFPAATANWGTVTHVGVYTAATGGTLLAYAPLAVAKGVTTGDVIRFAPDKMTFRTD